MRREMKGWPAEERSFCVSLGVGSFPNLLKVCSTVGRRSVCRTLDMDFCISLMDYCRLFIDNGLFIHQTQEN